MQNPPKPPFDVPPPPEEGAGDPLAREGLAWLLHLHSGKESPEDWQAFETWQNWSGAHKLAAARAKTLWEQLGPTLAPRKGPRKPGIPVVIAAAVGLAALGFAGGLFGPPASFFADYRSRTGEVRSVMLRDGSQVDLDTGTSFDVSDGDRTITLHTGQVFVKVQPGAPRRFVVFAGKVRAEALGTAYAVRRDGDAATVVVSESTVRVSQDGQKAAAVEVNAGNALMLSDRDSPGQPRAADVSALTAWRRGELQFINRPLSEVVAELDRYRRGKIVIIGRGIGELPISVNVEIADVDAFLASLQTALPVIVVRLPGLATIVRDPRR